MPPAFINATNGSNVIAFCLRLLVPPVGIYRQAPTNEPAFINPPLGQFKNATCRSNVPASGNRFVIPSSSPLPFKAALCARRALAGHHLFGLRNGHASVYTIKVTMAFPAAASLSYQL
jgi:hypothetical protein